MISLDLNNIKRGKHRKNGIVVARFHSNSKKMQRIVRGKLALQSAAEQSFFQPRSSPALDNPVDIGYQRHHESVPNILKFNFASTGHRTTQENTWSYENTLRIAVSYSMRNF